MSRGRAVGRGGRGAAVRCAVAPRCESDPVGEWQENTSRVAALHITHKRHQNEKARDARRRLAAPLSPRPRTGLSRVHRGRPWSDRPSRASPSVGAARAPDRSAAASGRRSYDGRRLRRAHSDAHETYNLQTTERVATPARGACPGRPGRGLRERRASCPVRPCPQKRPL